MKSLPKEREKIIKYLKPLARALTSRRYSPMIMQIYYTLKSILYIGNQFVCPCCEGHFRKFLPFGVKQRLNAQCPRCGSLERHRLLWLYLKNRTKFFSENLKVLHFAPEYCFQKTLRFMTNLDYISADIKSDLAMVKMDITNISCKDDSFDIILCNRVLEHVKDDERAMRELFRVLKPGGWAIIQVPIDLDKTFEDPNVLLPEERERVFGQKDHVRIYGRDYKYRLEKARFTVKVDNYVEELGADMIKKYGLMKNENIYFCTKPKPKEINEEGLRARVFRN